MSLWDWLRHRRQVQPSPSPYLVLSQRRPETLDEVAALERERAAIMARVADLCQDNALDHEDARRVDVA